MTVNVTIEKLQALARGAGSILRTGYEQEHEIAFKGVTDVVTEIDHRSESFLLQEIHQGFPGSHIVTEESGVISGSDDSVWYIDPLDGTVNYSHNNPVFCVSIAFGWKGRVELAAVYDPMRDEMFSASLGHGAEKNGIKLNASIVCELQKSLLITGFPYDTWDVDKAIFDSYQKMCRKTQGVRSGGSAALDICYVAAGRFDGFWERDLKVWDFAAAGLIAQEAGAIVTNFDGNVDYITNPRSILAAAPGLYSLLYKELHT